MKRKTAVLLAAVILMMSVLSSCGSQHFTVEEAQRGVVLLAALPRMLGPSSVDGPDPAQTVETSSGVESAPPTQEPAVDPGVDYLARFMETAACLRLDDMEVAEAELRAKLDALPIDELFTDAVHVAALAELDEALERADKPIVIDGDIDFSLDGGGGIFINRSTLRGAVILGDWDNDGVTDTNVMLNYGEITATEDTGQVNNLGWLWNTEVDSVLDTAHCCNVGLVQAGRNASVNLSGIRDGGGGAVLPFGWYGEWDEPEDVRLISSEVEFYQALEDRSCALIGLADGVSLTLTEDLDLTKGLAIADNCSLTMDGASLTVAGENGYLCADGPIDLRGGVLTVRDEAVAAVNELRDCGGIAIRNQGYLLLRSGLRPNDGAEIKLSDARYLCSVGPLELHQAQVSVDNALLRGTGGVELYGCTVDIAENGDWGEFLTDGCGVYFDPDTVITNRSGLALNGWDTQKFACQLTNYGQLETNDRAIISGSLVNHGRLRVWADDGALIRASGSLENHGTVEFKNGSQNASARFQPWAAGTVTGVPDDMAAD